MFTGWFIRLVGVLAVLGVIGFDGFSVVAAHLSASDDAQNVAQAGANAYKLNPTYQNALYAADQALPKGDTIVANSLTINTANGEVSVKIRRTANSVLLHLFSQTKSWAVVTEGGTADPPS
jgi:hypothetical protein